ncbi:MAG: LysR family transcriptional regulator [Alphaproteobacteria bacterium]
MHNDDIGGFVTFARVVEQESFTGAAEAMGISKSAVSKQVARLEETLGVRLLNRTTRKLQVTEAGRVFYERCRRIVDEVEEARAAVTSLQASPRGVLRITAPVSYGLLHLSKLLPAFMQRYPDLRVDLGLADRKVDLLAEGIDVAVRIGQMVDSSLVAKKITDFPRIVAATPSYWDANGRPETPDDLGRHNCFIYEYLPQGDQWEFRDPQSAAAIRVRVSGKLSSNNGDILLRAAEQGQGVSWIPGFFIDRQIKDGVLEEVLADYQAEPVGLYAVFPHSRHLPTKTRAFVDYLVEAIRGKAD